MIRYAAFRRYTAIGTILISVLFCGVIVYMLIADLSDFRYRAALGQRYMNAVHTAQSAVGTFEEQLIRHLLAPSEATRKSMTDAVQRMRTSLVAVVAEEEGIRKAPLVTSEEFEEQTGQMLSALSVLETESDNSLTVREALEQLNTNTGRLGRLLQGRLRYESSVEGVLARQTSYASETLLPVIILYLIVMTGFMVFSSLLSSELLNRYLRRIGEGARRISRGDLAFRFKPERSDDEIEGVMNDFDMMASRLDEQARMIRMKHGELIATTERLQEANAHKDRFLANMSHELRTPLNAVIGFAELLKTRAEVTDPERLRRYATQILDASEHLLSLISDLLEVARIDAGVRAPEWSAFDLTECLDNALTMIKPLAERKHLQLRWEPADDPMPVVADRRFICQIAINLLNNAVKFTHEGHVALRVADLVDEYRIEVEDTGIGIPHEEQELIFRDFHRVESHRTANYDGVGLGLTLTRRLVDFHGGSITVHSEPGQGSVFTVILPKHSSDSNPIHPTTQDEQ